MRRLARIIVVSLALIACDGSRAGEDAGTDAASPDAGLPVEQIALEGLDGPVEVIIDDRGIPHIYATTIHDLMMVEGYLMARDRFIQMEFIRRNVTGRLAEVLGVLDESLLAADIQQRFLGFGRQGRAIYESLPENHRTRLVAEAFVAGINAYIDRVVMDPAYQPPRGLELFNALRASPAFGHWEPADIFALARYQAFNLSYDADADIGREAARQGVANAFPADSSDSRIAARAGIFADFFSERPARRVYSRDGFNDAASTTALPPSPLPPRPGPRPAPARAPSLEALEGAERFFARLGQNPLFRRDPHIGSNSWVVHGDLTESGHPILANDPHLSLVSPPVWWYVHLNTERMGGEDALDVQGVAFAGLPGVVLGFNRNLAWSATTTGYDVTDVYRETVTFRNEGTPEEPVWVPESVRFNGEDVPITTIIERIGRGDGTTLEHPILVVPHHGPIIPDSIVEPTSTADPTGEALSIRYTGHEPSNELAFFVGLLSASSVEDAFAAQRAFMVGGQNFSYVSRDGDIAWSTRVRVPQREPAACTFSIDERGIVSGHSPLFVLPGEGGYEWAEDLEDDAIPHDQNPARGYIATANQDAVGVTDDGNPCNDAHYLGGGFAPGYRMHRIVERLDALAARGDITTEDMIALQSETKSSLGEGLRDPIVASLTRVLDGDSDDVAEAVLANAGEEGRAAVGAVRDRLAAWTLETPHAIGSTDPAEIADSVATTLFNATITRLASLAFTDESTRIGRGPGTGNVARLLEWAMADAATQQELPLYTFRTSYEGIADWNDTVLWDDLGTEDVVESRDERVVRAVLAAVAWLEDVLGAEWDEWRWGRLHAVRFEQIVPGVLDEGIVSIPPVGSEEFPLGFPRSGDYDAVDPGNFSLTNGQRFTFGSGASQRLVVEMTSDGPRAFNALPGGQSEDVDSPHHADEAELWRRNVQPPLYFERADVEEHAEARFRFVSP